MDNPSYKTYLLRKFRIYHDMNYNLVGYTDNVLYLLIEFTIFSIKYCNSLDLPFWTKISGIVYS